MEEISTAGKTYKGFVINATDYKQHKTKRNMAQVRGVPREQNGISTVWGSLVFVGSFFLDFFVGLVLNSW